MPIAEIAESLCIGCGICPKVCPFGAIDIVRVPTVLTKNVVHRHHANSFVLSRFPNPRKSRILGMLGSNGCGKSLAVRIMSGEIRPNFGGRLVDHPWRGQEVLQGLMKNYEHGNRSIVACKPQHLDRCAIFEKDVMVGDLFESKTGTSESLKIDELWQKKVNILSGGERQRVCIAFTALQQKDVFIFDEPSSFLDISQRIAAGRVIKKLSNISEDNVICVIDHDLTFLDYVADDLCCFYGKAAAYGICSSRNTIAEGVNDYITGYLSHDNVRFRKSALRFSKIDRDTHVSDHVCFSWPHDIISLDNGSSTFRLEINGGHLKMAEICLVLGCNGSGKTTFLRHLRSITAVAHKPQDPEDAFAHFDTRWRSKLVSEFLSNIATDMETRSLYSSLKIDDVIDRRLGDLSGGERQKVALVSCLSQNTDVYFIDEPSAYLDVEARLEIAKILKNLTKRRPHICMLVVDHDLLLSIHIADSVIVLDGTPGCHGSVRSPMSKESGFNQFLRSMGVTFRKDIKSGRPRVNSPGSEKDTFQKKKGDYFQV